MVGYVNLSKNECEVIAIPYLPLCFPSLALSGIGLAWDLVGICIGTSFRLPAPSLFHLPPTYLYSKTRKKQG